MQVSSTKNCHLKRARAELISWFLALILQESNCLTAMLVNQLEPEDFNWHLSKIRWSHAALRMLRVGHCGQHPVAGATQHINTSGTHLFVGSLA